jgi:hypothetical protein
MRRTLPLLVVLCASLPAQHAAEPVAALAAAPAYDDEIVGDAPSPVFRDYRRLVAAATPAGLRALAAHDSAIVRCYAVRGLVELGATKELPAVLREHALDTARVEVRTGCERYATNAGDLMFDLARPKLAGEELLDIAEHLVRGASPLYARQWALRNVRFRDGMLHAIRALAKGGDAAALIALARFRVASDVPLLAERLHGDAAIFDDNCVFLAAEVSRDARLLPALAALAAAAQERLRRDNAYRLRFWLLAIAAQRSPEAAELLKSVAGEPVPDAKKRADLQQAALEALEAHPAAAFAELHEHLRRELGR